MKIVVAIDSMKGCLTSKAASDACAQGLRISHPDASVAAIPVADGGEGTSEAIAASSKGIVRMKSSVTGPDGTDMDAEWWMDDVNKTAYMDMAAAAGLTLVHEDERNPMNTTSYGVGQLIMASIAKGAKHIILGLGGSATVDGGIGACQALGVRFFKTATFARPKHKTIGGSEYIEIKDRIKGRDLRGIADIDINSVDSRIKDTEILLACDVKAPFTGETGAAKIFGPQKGANPNEVEILEEGLENVRLIIRRILDIDLNDVAGSGAAGGCAGGLMSLIGAKITNGARLVLDSIDFDVIIEDADMIITGEGSADCQTLMGKLPFEILQRGKQKKIPVILVAGKIEDKEKLEEAGFAKVIDINSEEIALRSNTSGLDVMNPEVASARLRHIFTGDMV